MMVLETTLCTYPYESPDLCYKAAQFAVPHIQCLHLKEKIFFCCFDVHTLTQISAPQKSTSYNLFFECDSDSLGEQAGGILESPAGGAPSAPQATVIPGADSLIGDLLDMDLGGPTPYQQQQMYQQMPQSQAPAQGGVVDFLGGEGLDSLVRTILC
jgi:hypothetical protein